MQKNRLKSVKILYLIRHAKSSWKYNVPDDERPLKKRGANDALLVSNELKNSILIPDMILSSYAKRAKNTAQIFTQNLSLNNIEFKIKDALYDFSGSNLLNTIQSCDDNIDKLMVFGHNYAITNFVNTYGNKYIENVPTSGFVEIHFDESSWKILKKGKTERIVFPKDLKAKL